jgi:hypothetical protein
MQHLFWDERSINLTHYMWVLSKIEIKDYNSTEEFSLYKGSVLSSMYNHVYQDYDAKRIAKS